MKKNYLLLIDVCKIKDKELCPKIQNEPKFFHFFIKNLKYFHKRSYNNFAQNIMLHKPTQRKLPKKYNSV